MKQVTNTISLSSFSIKLSLILLLLFEVQNQRCNVGVLGYTREDFPPEFIFGSSTSAYQVEGAVNEGGRGLSVVDINAHNGEFNGDIAEVTCDQYHHYKEDIQLMVDLGLDAYRLSFAWSRIIPNGRGPVNPKGIEYYNNLINELLKNGVRPHVTLAHFDHPQALEEAYGGWRSRRMVEDFTNFADLCFKEFGDRVTHWVTINEPNYYAIKQYPKTPYLAGHHLLLGHASVVKLYKEKYQAKQGGVITLAVLATMPVPQTNAERDVAAAIRVREFELGWFVDPLVFGDYPKLMKQALGSRLPAFTEEERKLVKGSYDFLGIICYNATFVKDDPTGTSDLCRKAQCVSRAIGDKLVPGVMEYLKNVYGNPPTYIYENGIRTIRTSSLEDYTRINYLNATFRGLLNAIRNGSNVRGYFLWSILDVFEFTGGYKYSFGLYYVDLNDAKRPRYPKLSANWYSNFLKGKSNAGIIQQMNNSTFISQSASS